MTHICVSRLTIIGSDNGLSPDRRQAIIWTNAGLLLIGPLGTNFVEILIEILTFSFKKMRLKVSSAKRRPFCLGLNVLIYMTTYQSPNHWVSKVMHQPAQIQFQSLNGTDYWQVPNISCTFVGQLNYWSLRCSWSIVCRRCSNYIFILD